MFFNCVLIFIDTEIDWKAYMQEVQYFLNGERNYYNMRGDTGPLVYPAGFLYIFGFLHYATDRGLNILRGNESILQPFFKIYTSFLLFIAGQWIFALVYVLTIILVFVIYKRGGIAPNWILILLVLSKRIHSIFVLRMFNDCIASLIAMISIYLFSTQKVRNKKNIRVSIN